MGIIKAVDLAFEYIRRDEEGNVEGITRAVDGVTLDIQAGDFVAILGHNGSGKSTLMNILTDNVKRSSGEILWDGKEILEQGEEYRRLVGYMPQEQICYPQFSLQEFINYMAMLKGLNRKAPEVREQMDCRLLGVPARTIEVVAILWQTRQVDNAEVAAARRPHGVVWRRLTKIVEACPHELANNPRLILLLYPIVVGQISPSDNLGVVA